MVKKTRRISIIILGIVVVIVLLSLLQYILYSRNHFSKRTIEWQGNGKLLLEDGSEYQESVPIDLNAFYFDYGIFYPDKDEIRLEVKCAGNLFYDGYYYMENMEDRLCSPVTYEDGSVLDLEAYECSLVYVDYQEKGDSSFLFYLKDISKIVENGNPGQKGLLVVTESDSVTPEEVIQKAIRETEKEEPVWEDFITGQQ